MRKDRIMFLKNRCYNGGQQHKFEPRYTEMDREKNIEVSNYLTEEGFRHLLTLQVYVRDICVWCGKTIEKDLL